MGMYDTIKCEYPLPDKEVQNESFQSKDLDCLMEEYTITEEGKLIHHTVKYEEVPEKERPFYGTDKWDGFGKFFGCIKTVPAEDIEVPYHGDIRFYTYIEDLDSKNYKWYEYEARFTEGKLIRITKIKD